MQYNNRRPGGFNRQGGAPRGGQPYGQPAPIMPKPVPQDYVDEAERVMRTLLEDKSRITTSKLRGFLALISEIYNEENLRSDKKLSPASQAKLLRLRVKAVYDAGREPAVKRFVEQAQLLEYIKGVGTDRESLILLAHYMEALVAYHRHLGGKEN